MKLQIEIDKDRPEPFYYQIEEQVKALIVSGYFPADKTLPSIRSLAGDLGCSVITIRRAYQNLEQQNYIKTYHGKGSYALEVMREKSKEKAVYDTFWQAVKTARQHQYTDSEIKQLINIFLR